MVIGCPTRLSLAKSRTVFRFAAGIIQLSIARIMPSDAIGATQSHRKRLHYLALGEIQQYEERQ